MLRRFLPFSLSSAATLIVLPSVAADGTAGAAVDTGLGNTGIGLFIIAIAGALLLTLMFRASASRVTRIITEKIGKRRIHKILNARSPDLLEDFILPGSNDLPHRAGDGKAEGIGKGVGHVKGFDGKGTKLEPLSGLHGDQLGRLVQSVFLQSGGDQAEC